ncbi:MAG: transposase, partial [Thermodesulfobacteriota bacterium]
MQYPKERKEAILSKMMPPHNRPIADLAKEEGISEATLFKWRREAREQGLVLPNGNSSPERWSSQDKFNAVLESFCLNETELAEYCRRKGLYPEQINQWRIACESANDWDREANRQLKHQLKVD